MQTNHPAQLLLTEEVFPLLEKAAETSGEARVLKPLVPDAFCVFALPINVAECLPAFARMVEISKVTARVGRVPDGTVVVSADISKSSQTSSLCLLLRDKLRGARLHPMRLPASPTP